MSQTNEQKSIKSRPCSLRRLRFDVCKPDPNDLCQTRGNPLHLRTVDNLFQRGRHSSLYFPASSSFPFFSPFFLLSVFHHLISLRLGDTSTPSLPAPACLYVLTFRLLRGQKEEKETSLDMHAHPVPPLPLYPTQCCHAMPCHAPHVILFKSAAALLPLSHSQ